MDRVAELQKQVTVALFCGVEIVSKPNASGKYRLTGSPFSAVSLSSHSVNLHFTDSWDWLIEGYLFAKKKIKPVVVNHRIQRIEAINNCAQAIIDGDRREAFECLYLAVEWHNEMKRISHK